MSVLPTTSLHRELDVQAPPAAQRSIRIGLASALTIGPVALAFLLKFPSADLIYQSGVAYFMVVTGATLVALGLAALMLRAGVVRKDGRVLMIAAAFLALSSIFFVHAISTPGVLFRNTTHATTWSTPIALFAGSVLLALSAIDRVATQPWLAERWRRWVAVCFALWLSYAAFMLWNVPREAVQLVAPSTHTAQGQPGGDTSYPNEDAYSATAREAEPTTLPLQARMMIMLPAAVPLINSATVLLYSGTVAAYGRRLRRARTRPLLALTCGAVLLAETTIAAQLGGLWHLSFWLYHLLLLAAVITVVYGVIIGSEQYRSLSSAVEGLLLGTTLQRQRDGFQHGMASLLTMLEQRDATVLPELRAAMRQRFGLAEDQIELIEHAVTVVAGEREEQRRLRALAEVSRAAILNLDVDLLLTHAMRALAETTEATMCSVGLVQGSASFSTDRIGLCAASHRPRRRRYRRPPCRVTGR